jgi:branched-chain amino acid transport system substrate-binding protein
MEVKRGFTLLLVLLALVLAVSPLAAQDEEPIVIGAVFNSTGWMAAYDQPAQRGAEVAIAEINAAGGVLGRPLELVALDGETDPATVANAALQLVAEGADVIITPSDFDIGSPAAAAAQAAGLVGISPGASSPLFGATALGDMQFTLAAWTNYGSAASAEWGYNEAGWRTAYVIIDTSIDYSNSQGEYFIQRWEELGGEVVGRDSFVQGNADFSGQLQRLQALETQPDVIFIASYMPDLGTLVRDIRALGIETPILGGDAYDTTEFYDVLGEELGNEVYFSTHSYMNPELSEGMETFFTDYEAMFETTPDNSFIALGYDAVYVLAQAIEEAGSTEGAAVAEAMRTLEYDLLTGSLDWGDVESGHETVKELFIIGLEGGEPSLVTRFIPEAVPNPFAE